MSRNLWTEVIKHRLAHNFLKNKLGSPDAEKDSAKRSAMASTKASSETTSETSSGKKLGTSRKHANILSLSELTSCSLGILRFCEDFELRAPSTSPVSEWEDSLRPPALTAAFTFFPG